MENAAIADNFDLLAKLMDIHGENSFKARTYGAAAFNIEKLPQSLKNTPREELSGIRGIGDSVAQKVIEMLDTGQLEILNEYIRNTPAGVIEMLQIKGIGPKKINTIWKEMGIESIGELQYACHENRLTRYKGFGEKTQQNVLASIQFYLQNQGHFLYAQLEAIYPQVDGYLKKIFGAEKVAVTGDYRRQALTIEEMAFVIAAPVAAIKKAFQTAQPPELLEEHTDSLLYQLSNGLKLRLHITENNLATTLFQTTGSPAFLEAFQQAFPDQQIPATNAATDDIYFAEAGIAIIPPCLRETASVIDLAKKNALPQLIQPEDIRGIIHSHSKWSDGSNTLEEMATACIEQGFEYLVISDHSQTAAYANGLKEDRIWAQHQEIDMLNKKIGPFKIFKSIESDILNDGSLDYPEEVLKTFDLVIASVHSNLQMTEEKAMGRLIKAIENPYTRILGHMTGRLLLSRNGYPVNHEKIIDACAANKVVIEINAHPRRLDMDWRWIQKAVEKGVLLSINPDAHFIEGYKDVKYGVLAAQKGGLTKEWNLSSFGLKEFEKWLFSK
ncbi:MAG: DNA polymerase/3'-5' exonuclease PolX [Chitinophagaceae bacterium]|nr:DNA polymerase/3'-5' exonuclease PolX [Chitinophagaceae bacterium]